PTLSPKRLTSKIELVLNRQTVDDFRYIKPLASINFVKTHSLVEARLRDAACTAEKSSAAGCIRYGE
ncbi:hypothetical protein OAG71_03535, partial [bacterium]|nr:hypothetical protein [bacterium]